MSQDNAKALLRVCVVYDAESGEVKHIHNVVALPGADIPAEDRIAERALTVAKRLREHESVDLRTLHVSPGAIKPLHKHRVDVTSGTLVSEPIRSQRSGAPKKPTPAEGRLAKKRGTTTQ